MNRSSPTTAAGSISIQSPFGVFVVGVLALAWLLVASLVKAQESPETKHDGQAAPESVEPDATRLEEHVGWDDEGAADDAALGPDGDPFGTTDPAPATEAHPSWDDGAGFTDTEKDDDGAVATQQFDGSKEGDFGWEVEERAPRESGALSPDGRLFGTPLELHGMTEGAVASRISRDPHTPDQLLLAEARARLDLLYEVDRVAASAKVDFVADEITSSFRLDVREAQALVSPTTGWELGAGRRVMTWGTGDLVFVNDLFPKDFVSFFIGRDDEFLKLPANHVRSGLFSKWVNWDFVWMPVFQPDKVPSGERIPVYSPATGEFVVEEGVMTVQRPDKKAIDGEFATRVSGTVVGIEWALYGYVGYTKQPLAFDPQTNTLTYARQGVYGASLRYPLLGGLVNLEGAYYDAWQNRDGKDPNQPAPSYRGLLGYEHELSKRVTMSAQYFVDVEPEHFESARPERQLHWLTARLTVRALRDQLTLSAFALYDPFNKDGHARLAASYRIGDAARVTLGSNLMAGKNDFSFFGQFQSSSNVYARLRVSF